LLVASTLAGDCLAQLCDRHLPVQGRESPALRRKPRELQFDDSAFLGADRHVGVCAGCIDTVG
jgi:hypothetical protein